MSAARCADMARRSDWPRDDVKRVAGHGGGTVACPVVCRVHGTHVRPLPRPTAATIGEGDCAGSIRFRGHNYRGHNLLNQQAPRGRLLGVGDVVGCGWRTASPVDRVKVYAVSGVDPSLAVKILGVDWQAVYVARGVGQSAWPQVLKK